ncbi:MAG: hypothetical protein ABSH56_26250 [Bryobacteraceae bacterium]|jgi:hypothetical protein
MSENHAWLRHTVATLAYRGAKTLRGAPADFGDFLAGESTRTPRRILAHIGDLMEWALSQANGTETWHDSEPAAWEAEVARFHQTMAALDARLANAEPLAVPAERLFQGAIADAIAHVGQLALLRRLAGAPIKGENYSRAQIEPGTVGPEQAAPRREF